MEGFKRRNNPSENGFSWSKSKFSELKLLKYEVSVSKQEIYLSMKGSRGLVAGVMILGPQMPKGHR